MQLSIIIPVYKVEKYIRGTLDSIYNQNVNTNCFEVIVVNDGTPDSSMSIVDEFSVEQANLRIINQTNEGLSCARNAGLAIAKGDYIWFVDSDDQLSPNSIEQVLQNVTDAQTDIMGFDIIRVNEDTRDEEIQRVVIGSTNLYNRVCSCYELVGKIQDAPVQRFVFRHSFLSGNELTFYPHIIHEDQEFNARAFFLARKIMMVPITPYHYLVRSSGSIMASFNMRSVECTMIIIQSLQNLKKKHAITIRDKMYIDNEIFFFVTDILVSKMKGDSYRAFIKQYYSLYRSLAWRGFYANISPFHIKKILKALGVMIHPMLFRMIYKLWIDK